MRSEAIMKIHPEVTTINGDNEAWDENGDLVVIDETKVAEEIEKIKAEEKLILYKSQRASEYPSIQDCIHALLDGGDTLSELQAKRTAIKEKYPKPE
jgi:ABC-type Na+ transport system ATPase subunit NatA